MEIQPPKLRLPEGNRKEGGIAIVLNSRVALRELQFPPSGQFSKSIWRVGKYNEKPYGDLVQVTCLPNVSVEFREVWQGR